MAEILPTLPDMVPLTYFYFYKTTYWVEPDTGVLVDYEKLESRQVALNLGSQPVPVGEVMHLEYAQTDASVAVAAQEASDARSQLFWFGKVLPIALIAGGVLLALFGLVRLNRKSA